MRKTDHMTLVQRADWQVSMIEAFLDAPGPLRPGPTRPETTREGR